MERRDLLKLLAIAPFGSSLHQGTLATRDGLWTPDWDRALIQAAVEQQDSAFDPAESMLRRELGDAYNYHSALRSRVVHPTQPSLSYALALFERGGEPDLARGRAIVERVLALQETDPESKWYGSGATTSKSPRRRWRPPTGTGRTSTAALLL